MMIVRCMGVQSQVNNELSRVPRTQLCGVPVLRLMKDDVTSPILTVVLDPSAWGVAKDEVTPFCADCAKSRVEVCRNCDRPVPSLHRWHLCGGQRGRVFCWPVCWCRSKLAGLAALLMGWMSLSKHLMMVVVWTTAHQSLRKFTGRVMANGIVGVGLSSFTSETDHFLKHFVRLSSQLHGDALRSPRPGSHHEEKETKQSHRYIPLLSAVERPKGEHVVVFYKLRLRQVVLFISRF